MSSSSRADAVQAFVLKVRTLADPLVLPVQALTDPLVSPVQGVQWEGRERAARPAERKDAGDQGQVDARVPAGGRKPMRSRSSRVGGLTVMPARSSGRAQRAARASSPAHGSPAT